MTERVRAYIEQLKERPEAERTRIAFLVAVCVAGCLFVGWSFYFVGELRTVSSVDLSLPDVAPLQDKVDAIIDDARASARQSGTDEVPVRDGVDLPAPEPENGQPLNDMWGIPNEGGAPSDVAP